MEEYIITWIREEECYPKKWHSLIHFRKIIHTGTDKRLVGYYKILTVFTSKVIKLEFYFTGWSIYNFRLR